MEPLTLVTGASGHIGGAITQALLARGRRVRALVRAESRLDGLLARDGKPLPGLELARGEMQDYASLESALQGVTRVFHAAAVYRNGAPEDEIFSTNVEGVGRLMNACAAQGKIERLVLTSSVVAIGARNSPEEVLEECHWNNQPQDAYGSSKTEGEWLAHDLARRFKLPLVVVNPSLVLGPRDYRQTPSSRIALRLMREGAPVWFDGGLSVVDVDDVAEGHIQAELKGGIGERYILGGERLSYREFFTLCARIGGKRVPHIKAGRRVMEWAGLWWEWKAKWLKQEAPLTRARARKMVGNYMFYDSDKAVRDLGWRFRTAAETLNRSFGWYLDQGWLG